MGEIGLLLIINFKIFITNTCQFSSETYFHSHMVAFDAQWSIVRICDAFSSILFVLPETWFHFYTEKLMYSVEQYMPLCILPTVIDKEIVTQIIRFPSSYHLPWKSFPVGRWYQHQRRMCYEMKSTTMSLS